MKIKHILLTATAIVALSTNTIFASNSFSDVSSGSWYYDTVTEASDLGLFSGTGNGLFSPSQTMTRAEFVTVVMRAIAPDADYSTSGAWWQGYYDVAVDSGILLSSEFDGGDMTKDMSRQEMALVLVRAMEYTGESVASDVSTSMIADYSSIGSYYKDDVLTAYSNGLISGYTDGTFLPDGVMTRAEGASVLMRLVDSSLRKLPTEEVVEIVAVEGAITIYEGQNRTDRLAQVGDIFVKSDGTQIVLKKDSNGVLAGGQGVAADEGLYLTTSKGKDYIEHNTKVNETSMTDSLGNKLQSTEYWINSLTGEGHWALEWSAITSKPTSSGSYAFELSSDMNWYWSATAGTWAPIFSNGQADLLISNLTAANGL